MEYAAVFLLFSVTIAAAIRVCASGKGVFTLAFLVLTTLTLCPEQSGEGVRFSPALLFCALAGTAYIGYEKDIRAIVCSLVVATVAAGATTSRVDVAGIAYVGAAAFCALMLKPFSAGGALAVGYVLGDTYSFFADKALIFRYELFSVNTVYAAIFCTFLAALTKAVSDVYGARRGRGRAVLTVFKPDRYKC